MGISHRPPPPLPLLLSPTPRPRWPAPLAVPLPAMNLSEDWRAVFPACGVFAAPSADPLPAAAAASSRGPLHFSPLPPRTPLLSLPYPIPIPPPPSSTGDLNRLLRSFVRDTSFLPRSDLDSLAETLLPEPQSPAAASSSSPPPSNLLAVLRLPRCSLVLFFFPYGENADHVAFVTLDATACTSTPLSPPVVQRHGFMHPGHRIQQLATTANQSSSWPSSQPGGGPDPEGFLLAVTMYSLNWFRVESRGEGTCALVPVAKHQLDSVIVQACWSRHLPSECAVLLENGELCWFNLDTRQGGKMKINVDGTGEWLSCDYGAQPWMIIVATSKSVLLIDLRYGGHGQYKVLAGVGMAGLLETGPKAEADRYLAFCRAGFDHFHFSVVTERNLMVFDVRQPLAPVLAWQHQLESPSNVSMFRLSELRPSKEHEWASKSGFAILVGPSRRGQFGVFCYGPKQQGCPEKSHLYAWDLPSRFSLTGRHCSCSNGIMKDVFSMPVSSQQSNNSIIGYCVLPSGLSVSETSSFTGFALVCLTASGKLEMQRYHASADSHDDIPCECDESQHTARASDLAVCPDTLYGNISGGYDFIKLDFLSEHLEGNLCNALVKHGSSISKEMGQIVVSEAVSEYAKDNSSSLPQPVSDFLCNVSVPMNIFEISCQKILNGLPSDIVRVTFSKYKDMRACSSDKTLCEHLDVPACLTNTELRPFLLAKPSSINYYLTSKAVSPNALVGPVLPIPFLLALEDKSKDAESSSEGVHIETDSINDRCREVFEAIDPVISIADSENGDGWSGSQELNEEKSYFSYEPQIERRFSMDRSTRKEEKEDQNQGDLHTSSSSTLYEDKIFTTFVCGKAKVPGSPAQAATSLFDFSPVRMDFDTPAIEMQPDEEKVYKCLRKQFVTWQNSFKPYQDFCSSHKIPKPKQ